MSRCARAGVEGGAVYDAVFALTAFEAGETLRTRDVRAVMIYRRLGIEVELIS